MAVKHTGQANEAGYRTFKLGDYTFARDEYFTHIEWPGAQYREDWTWADTAVAGAAWAQYVQKRRAKQVAKRPVADVLIGSRYQRRGSERIV